MTAAQRLRKEIAKIGYAAIVPNYVFSDVFASPPRNRTVSLAAFTYTPPSYRNSALAVVTDPQGRTAEELASEYRALGAPLLFVVEGENVTAWQIRSEASPRIVARATQDELSALFSEKREAWGPRSIQHAKSAGMLNEAYQLDFVDAGLLPAIEGEIHAKLDRLLRGTLDEAMRAQSTAWKLDERTLFQIVFRFLAAKILQDRSHELAKEWDTNDAGTVLDAISRYYNLPFLGIHRDFPGFEMAEAAWRRLNVGINFQNISADDLAFVYENTLVTPDTRKEFGTHSTPWQVVEYIVGRLSFDNYRPEDITVYEPFAGAAVFLVSALRHLREMLPVGWTDAQRHNFLINRLFGDELESFAVEVARLSLILADYPNHNGWQINHVDLFEGEILAERMRDRRIILCNPPFEAFSGRERVRYPIAATTHLKPAAVLNKALDSHPLALGFVMPRSFIQERQFAKERRRLESLYASIELVELPDRTFRESEDGAALVIAKEPRPPAPALIKLRSTEVMDLDRLRFLRSGEITASRDHMRLSADEPSGNLWIPRLRELWDYLASQPRLETMVSTRWGLQWTYSQSKAVSTSPREGFRKGIHNARGSHQFVSPTPLYLDYRPEFVRRAYGQAWELPKLIMSAGRRGRGAWRITAFVDTSGLLYSQQFYGLWPLEISSDQKLLALAAVLNGPLASAYIAAYSPESRLRKTAVERIPIPRSLPLHVAPLVSEYLSRLSDRNALTDVRAICDLLMRIDAIVLDAYELPPRLERAMLETFRRSTRPTEHDWSHWLPEDFRPFIPLNEYVSGQYKQATGNWLSEAEPLPDDEATAIREILG